MKKTAQKSCKKDAWNTVGQTFGKEALAKASALASQRGLGKGKQKKTTTTNKEKK